MRRPKSRIASRSKTMPDGIRSSLRHRSVSVSLKGDEYYHDDSSSPAGSPSTQHRARKKSWLSKLVPSSLVSSSSSSASAQLSQHLAADQISGVDHLGYRTIDYDDDDNRSTNNSSTEPRLAEQTATIAIQSLPSHLNRIVELEDESSSACEDDLSPTSGAAPTRFTKNARSRRRFAPGQSTKVSVLTKKYEETVQQQTRSNSNAASNPFISNKLTPAQRSKSLTQLECMDDEDLMAFDAVDSSNTAAVTEADRAGGGGGGGFRGHRPHLAVSMGDLSKVEQQQQQRGSANRLQKAATSKMPSQEYFTCTFESSEDSIDLVAQHGITLREALHDFLEERGLDVNGVYIHQEPCNTLITPTWDTARLAGRKLRLRVKETNPFVTSKNKANGFRGDKPELQKKLSTGSSKGRRGGIFGGGSSADEPGPPAPLLVQNSTDGGGTWGKGKTSKSTEDKGGGIRGFFNPFKSDNDKLDALTKLLDRYNQNPRLPDLPGLITFNDSKDDEVDSASTIYYMEPNWTDIVLKEEEIPERLKQQQNAVWELLTTEVNYIHQLKVITERFKLCLCNIQNEGILNEISIDEVFSNVQEIQTVNMTFWEEHLLPMVRVAREGRQPLNPVLMSEGFIKFEQLFQPYTKYCFDRPMCLKYIKDKKGSSDLFKSYVVWCETQKECDRQKFTDFIVKPMQRLTKYSLLLKAVLKHTESPEARQELNSMLTSVESFVNNVNVTLRKQHEQERLASIIHRIESYDVIEAKDDDVQKLLRQYLELDLTRPMPGCHTDMSRQLLREGDLKLRDATKSGMDVRCFLFTDMLLVCKSLNKKGDRVKVVRQPYVIDRLVVHELRERSSLVLIYLNEFQVATAVYMLTGNDVKSWAEEIRKAQDLYKTAKSSTLRPGFGFLATEDDEELDFPSHALLTTRSPRSSQSSLIHSHSGSVDMSDPSSGCVSHGRAVSLEFAEVRASSASSDEGSGGDPSRGRTKSLELRTNQPHSPIPERRHQYRYKSNSGSSSPNTLGVHMYSTSCDSHMAPSETELSPTSLFVPSPKTLSPTNRTVTHPPLSPRLKRSLAVPQSCKPPLVKTKNISSASGATSPRFNTQSFDFDVPVIMRVTNTSSPESEDENGRKLSQKRTLRNDRRYHTADSIENLKRAKDPSIHKRFSLNYPTSNAANGTTTANCEKRVVENCMGKTPSQESVYTSSGVSSTWSLQQNSECDFIFNATDEFDGPSPPRRSSPPVRPPLPSLPPQLRAAVNADVKIDVSEIQDGISSVQIRVQENSMYPTKEDVLRMKEIILNDKLLEASEV